jgi:hypothetical protein
MAITNSLFTDGRLFVMSLSTRLSTGQLVASSFGDALTRIRPDATDGINCLNQSTSGQAIPALSATFASRDRRRRLSSTLHSTPKSKYEEGSIQDCRRSFRKASLRLAGGTLTSSSVSVASHHIGLLPAPTRKTAQRPYLTTAKARVPPEPA